MTPTEKQTAMVGGQTVQVKYRTGESEPIFVRQIPVAEMQRYAASLQNEAVMADMFCSKPAGWSATVSDESFEQVIELGEEINAFFFARWMARQRKRAERIAPGVTEKIASRITSPNSPSNAE